MKEAEFEFDSAKVVAALCQILHNKGIVTLKELREMTEQKIKEDEELKNK